MKMLILPVACCLTGCAQFAKLQTDLTEQARKGVVMLGQSSAQKDQIIQRYHTLLRKQLDDAFDQDATEQSSLTAEWVIEARRAYAAALDHLAKQKQSSQQAIESDHRTAQAADLALQRLQWLQQIQSEWLNLFQEKP